MTLRVLDQCPICLARLDSVGPCRRCRAELGAVRRTAEASAALAGVALYWLAANDIAAAIRLLRRASLLRATPDLARLLSAIVGGEGSAGARGDLNPIDSSLVDVASAHLGQRAQVGPPLSADGQQLP